jgi:hypothetical protein
MTYRNGIRTKCLTFTELNEGELKLALQYDITFTLNLNLERLKKRR